MHFGVEDRRERCVAAAVCSGTLTHNETEEDFWRSRPCGTQGWMDGVRIRCYRFVVLLAFESGNHLWERAHEHVA